MVRVRGSLINPDPRTLIYGGGMRPHLLNASEVEAQIDQLPEWESHGTSISRTFTGTSFTQVIDWVIAIAAVAEQMDHHPDLDIRWTKLTIALTTHDRAGLTQLDFDQAAVINQICT